jgi:acetyl-CoA carboxylase biotin carboxyl carrier protein
MSMKMEELLQLIDAVSESNLTELEYKDENAEISLKKKLQPIQSAQQIEEVSCMEEIVQQKAILNKNEADGLEQKKGKIVTAPLVGTFYAAPAEDEEPFVKVGDRVEKGQIVAIIEAMKLMNEIESDFEGTNFCREWSVCRIWTATFCSWITGKVRTERCTV